MGPPHSVNSYLYSNWFRIDKAHRESKYYILLPHPENKDTMFGKKLFTDIREKNLGFGSKIKVWTRVRFTKLLTYNNYSPLYQVTSLTRIKTHCLLQLCETQR